MSAKKFETTTSKTITKMSDHDLFKIAQKYGANAKMWRQKFAGLLPEIDRRKLYKKKGFGSIFEFAAKLAGMSNEQVRRILNLEKRFEDKLILKEMLSNGEVSVNKLTRVASIVTTENQAFWATQIQVLPSRALETLIRDERRAITADQNERNPGHNLEQNNQINREESVHVHTFQPGKMIGQMDKKLPLKVAKTLVGPNQLQLSPEVSQKLLELQQKGININELLMGFLKNRELEIAQKKEAISVEMEEGRKKGPPAEKNSRYIPIKVRRILQKEHGTKCSMPGCFKESEVIHHTQRFALSKTHNPHYLAPLCGEHHTIAHSIDQRVWEKRRL